MRVVRPGLSEWLYRFCNAFGFMTDRLYPLEAFLIGKLFEVLPEGYRAAFEKQFVCLKIFQRSGWGWTMLAMFPMRYFWQRRGAHHFPAELRVAVDRDDVRLASFKFRVRGREEENNAVFHVVEGRLFSIDFGEDYRPIRFADDLEIIRYKINRSDFPSLESLPEQDGGGQRR